MDKKLKEFIAAKKLSDEAILATLQAAEAFAAAPKGDEQGEEQTDSDGETESEESSPAEPPAAPEPAKKGLELKVADLQKIISDTVAEQLKGQKKPGKPEPKPKPKLPSDSTPGKFMLYTE